MYQGKRILAVVPARGGSKGLPMKNLRCIAGIPLVGWAGNTVKEVVEIDRAVVSTDHDEIARVAESFGLAAPFRRPEGLSGDRIGDVDVLCNAIEEMERIDHCRYDVVVMLQPTSPLRKAEHVRQSIHHLVDGGHDAVWTVSPTDLKYHPLKQLSIKDGALGYFDPRGSGIIARQQLQPVYHRNGAAYALTRECLLDRKVLMGTRAAAVVIEETMVSIDTEEDLARVEAALARRSNTAPQTPPRNKS